MLPGAKSCNCYTLWVCWPRGFAGNFFLQKRRTERWAQNGRNISSAVTSAFFSCATSTEARVAVDRGEDRGVQMGSGSGVMTALVLGA